MWIACLGAIVASFLHGNAARGDSVLNIQPETTNGFLVLNSTKVTWTVTSNNGVDAVGVLKVTGTANVAGRTGQLIDSVHFGTAEPNAISFNPAINPAYAFTVSATIDIHKAVTLSGTTYSATALSSGNNIHIQGQDMHGHNLTFANSNDLVAFAMNLDGTTSDSMITYVFEPAGSYYSALNQSYVVAQLKFLGNNPGGTLLNNPMSGANFFTGIGTTTVWNEGAYAKMDVFGVALPLPAPFWTGTILLACAAAGASLIKRRRVS
jgi:hypothetical protein